MIQGLVLVCLGLLLLTLQETAGYTTSNTTNALIFFVHADYGKGGSDGQQSNHRRTRRRRRLHDDDGGEGEEHEEHEHKAEVFYQGKVADAMALTANSTPPAFIMALGDNFYPDGVYDAVNDSTWQTFYRDVYYNRFPQLRGVPWHAAVGNHDLGYGDWGVQALVNRTYDNSTDDDGGEWQMPARYYTVKYDIPDGGGYLQIVVVDTTWLAPATNEATSEVNDTLKAARLYEQMSFLLPVFQETLQYPRPNWLLVMGHYQIFSHGEKGDNSELVSYLEPFLSHFGVHAYFCGHDHLMEHLEYSGINYFVSGASTMNGGVEDSSDSAANLTWSGENYSGFSRVMATSTELAVDFLDYNGTVVYSHTQNNGRKFGKTITERVDEIMDDTKKIPGDAWNGFKEKSLTIQVLITLTLVSSVAVLWFKFTSYNITDKSWHFNDATLTWNRNIGRGHGHGSGSGSGSRYSNNDTILETRTSSFYNNNMEIYHGTRRSDQIRNIKSKAEWIKSQQLSSPVPNAIAPTTEIAADIVDASNSSMLANQNQPSSAVMYQSAGMPVRSLNHTQRVKNILSSAENITYSDHGEFTEMAVSMTSNSAVSKLSPIHKIKQKAQRERARTTPSLSLSKMAPLHYHPYNDIVNGPDADDEGDLATLPQVIGKILWSSAAKHGNVQSHSNTGGEYCDELQTHKTA